MRRLIGLGSFVAISSLALTWACSDSVPGSRVDDGAAANGTGAQGSGAEGSGASSSGGSSSSTAGLGNLSGSASGGSDGTGEGGDGSGGGEACASTTAEAALAPVYLVFLLDESGSMGDGKNGDRTEKWDPVTSALNSFFADPESAGITASLGLFPLNKNMTQDAADNSIAPDCQASAYGVPEVEPTPLPDDKAFKEAIAKLDPPNEYGTPTFPALVGTIDYAESLLAEDATRKVAVVMVTDGEPTMCTSKDATKTNNIANTAKAAADVADHLPTYVIGVGDDLAALNAIAEGGGTKEAFIVSLTDPEQTRKDLLSAINLIRGESISCELDIPAPPPGQKLDPDKVNVHFSAAGKPDASLEYGTACQGTTAWHYDDPAHPTKILLCDDTCAAVKAEAMGKLAVEFACKSRVVVQ